MSGNNKRSSFVWAVGISLGMACSAGVVHAGSISDTYTKGGTLTVTTMDNIKAAVNGNAGDIGTLTTTVNGNTGSITSLTGTVNTLTTSVTNLQTGAGTCTPNAGDDPDGIVRVGAICVDKYQARADFTGCALDGTTGCTTIATSTSGASAATSMSWAQAARACANAGKRLLTPGEWLTANTLGTLVGIADGKSEWVDAVVSIDPTGNNTGVNGDGTIGVGIIGLNIGGSGSGGATSGTGVPGFVAEDGYAAPSGTTRGFRCAR